MQITPYLNFDGQCAEAFELYAKLFDGKITFMMTFGESPMAGDLAGGARAAPRPSTRRRRRRGQQRS